jgi:predicted regulator of Ras-like GTPase activity (Roadblock/LC7/MglB family)
LQSTRYSNTLFPFQERGSILTEDEGELQQGYDFQRKKTRSTADELKIILGELSVLDWVDCTAVVRRDGVLMAFLMSKTIAKEARDSCAILSATILGAAKSICAKHRIGIPNRVIIQSKSCDIILAKSGNTALLLCQTNVRYDPTLMDEQLDKTVQRIEAVI